MSQKNESNKDLDHKIEKDSFLLTLKILRKNRALL